MISIPRFSGSLDKSFTFSPLPQISYLLNQPITVALILIPAPTAFFRKENVVSSATPSSSTSSVKKFCIALEIALPRRRCAT